MSFKKLDRKVQDEYLWKNAKRLKQEAVILGLVSSSDDDDEAGPSGSNVSE